MKKLSHENKSICFFINDFTLLYCLYYLLSALHMLKVVPAGTAEPFGMVGIFFDNSGFYFFFF